MPTGKPSASPWCVASAGDHRRRVARRDPRGEAALRDEVPLELLRVDELVAPGEEPGVLAVEVDELLRDGLALRRVGAQQLRPGPPAQDGAELPPEVPRVGHRHVHALPGLRAVRVAGVAGDEDPRVRPVVPHVVERVAEPLADRVHRPPPHVLHLDRVRVQDPVRHLRRAAPASRAVLEHPALVERVELEVHPHEVAALARDEQQVAVLARTPRTSCGCPGSRSRRGRPSRPSARPSRRPRAHVRSRPGWRCASRRSRRRTARGSSSSHRSPPPRSVCRSATVTPSSSIATSDAWRP